MKRTSRRIARRTSRPLRSNGRRTSRRTVRNPMERPVGPTSNLTAWVERTYAPGTPVKIAHSFWVLPSRGILFSAPTTGNEELRAGSRGVVTFSGTHSGIPYVQMEIVDARDQAGLRLHRLIGQSLNLEEAHVPIEDIVVPLVDNWAIAPTPMKRYALPSSQKRTSRKVRPNGDLPAKVEPWSERVYGPDMPWSERLNYSSYRKLDPDEIGRAWMRMVRLRGYGGPDDCHEAIDLATRRSVDYGVFLALADTDPNPGWRTNNMRDQVSSAVREYVEDVKSICEHKRTSRNLRPNVRPKWGSEPSSWSHGRTEKKPESVSSPTRGRGRTSPALDDFIARARPALGDKWWSVSEASVLLGEETGDRFAQWIGSREKKGLERRWDETGNNRRGQWLYRIAA